MVDKCTKLPDSIFQLSEYVVRNHPELAGFLAAKTNDLLSLFSSIHDFIILSGLLLSVAETLLLYFYIVMLPVWILQKGMKLLMYAAGILLLALFCLVIYNEDSVEEQHEYINEKLS